jgi:hypothetical protein
VITVCHDWVDENGLKEPKMGSAGTVPIPAAVELMINEIRKTAIKQGPEDFVMESPPCPGQPLGKTYFETALARDLTAIGIPGRWRGKTKKPDDYVNEQAKRNQGEKDTWEIL